MIHKRNAYTIHIEDMAFTFMKPLSGEHNGKLLKVYEDAYGDMKAEYMRIEDIKDRYEISDVDFNTFLTLLGEAYDES